MGRRQRCFDHVNAEQLLAAAGAMQQAIARDMHKMATSGALYRVSVAIMRSTNELAEALGQPDRFRDPGWSCLGSPPPAGEGITPAPPSPGAPPTDDAGS